MEKIKEFKRLKLQRQEEMISNMAHALADCHNIAIEERILAAKLEKEKEEALLSLKAKKQHEELERLRLEEFYAKVQEEHENLKKKLKEEALLEAIHSNCKSFCDMMARKEKEAAELILKREEEKIQLEAAKLVKIMNSPAFRCLPTKARLLIRNKGLSADELEIKMKDPSYIRSLE
jgi:hypothetical protein